MYESIILSFSKEKQNYFIVDKNDRIISYSKGLETYFDHSKADLKHALETKLYLRVKKNIAELKKSNVTQQNFLEDNLLIQMWQVEAQFLIRLEEFSQPSNTPEISNSTIFDTLATSDDINVIIPTFLNYVEQEIPGSASAMIFKKNVPIHKHIFFSKQAEYSEVQAYLEFLKQQDDLNFFLQLKNIENSYVTETVYSKTDFTSYYFCEVKSLYSESFAYAIIFTRSDEGAEKFVKIKELLNIVSIHLENHNLNELLIERAFQFKQAERLAKLGTWELDLKTKLFSCSDEVYRIFDTRPQEFVPNYAKFQSYIHPQDREMVAQIIQDSDTTGEFEFSYRVKTDNDSLKYLYSKGKVLFDQDEKPVKRIGALLDVSAQKEAQEETLRTQIDLLMAQKISRTGNFEINPDTNGIFLSETIYDILELNRSSKPTIEMLIYHVSEEYRDMIIRGLGTVLENKKRTTFECSMRTEKSNKVIWVLWHFHPNIDPATSEYRFVGTLQDITALKTTDKQLQDSEARFRVLSDLTRESLIILSKYIILDCNKALQRLTGYTEYELIGMNINTIVPKDSMDKIAKHNLGPKKVALHHEILTKAGDLIQVEGLAQSIMYKGRKCKSVVLNDITKRLKNETEKEKITKELVDAQSAAKIGSWKVVFETDEIVWSDQLYAIFEIDTNKTNTQLREEYFSKIEPNDLKYHKELTNALISKGNSYEMEYNISTSTGYKYIYANGNPIFDSSGVAIGMYGLVQDITARKEAEKLLENTQANLLEAQRIAGIGFWEHYFEPEKSIWSDTIFDIFEVDKHITKNISTLFDKMVHPEDQEHLDFLTKQTGLLQASHTVEYRIIVKNKHIKHIFANIFPIVNESGKTIGLKGLTQDITERKINELRLEQSESRYKSFISESTEGIYRYELDPPILTTLPVNEQATLLYENAFFVECNSTFAKMYGFENADDINGLRMNEFIHNKNDVVDSNVIFIENSYTISAKESVEIDIQGKKHYFLNHAHAIIENNYVTRVWGTQKEITELKLKEFELKQSEDRYKLFISDSSEGIYRLEMNPPISVNEPIETQRHQLYHHAVCMECNDIHAKMYGYNTAAEIIGKYMNEFTLNSEERKKDLTRFVKNGYLTAEKETIEVDKEGIKHYFISYAHGVIENGYLVRVWGTQRETTVIHDSQIKLQKSEARFRTILETSPDLIMILDSSGTYRDIFTSDKNLLFETKETLLNKNFKDVFSETVANEFMEIINTVLHSGKVHYQNYPLTILDGTERWFTGSFARFEDENEILIMWVARDITDQMDSEEKLKQSEQRWHYALSGSNDGVWDADIEHNDIYLSEQYCDMLGYKQNELTSAMFDGLVHPEDLDSVKKHIKNHFIGQTKLYQSEFRIKCKNGTYKWILARGKILEYMKNGDPKRFIGTHADITSIKLVENELLHEKEQLSVTLSSLSEGVITTGINGQILLMNKAAEIITGWFRDDAINQNFFDIYKIIDRDTGERFTDTIDRAISGVYIKRNQRPALLIDKQGNEKIISEGISVIYNDNGKPVGTVIIISDITEQERMEEEIIRSQRLDSLGVLAGGLAHDFNNILTGIMGNISLALMMGESKPAKMMERISEAEIGCNRAKDLTMQLLTFSKGGEPIKRTRSLVLLLKECVQFSLRGSNIEPLYYISNDIPYVDIDESQINQVINNLVINASQAMSSGGNITLELKKVEVETDTLNLKRSTYVKLSVIDKGCGIPEKNIEKIFDPFFTTKEEGNGLGLSSCYSIIKKHRGTLQVESTIGIGTTFSIFLPASENTDINEVITHKEVIKGNGRVLLMDDEAAIRDVMTIMMEGLGYEIDTSRDGSLAIELYKKSIIEKNEYVLVILDLTVPGGMGGKEAMSNLLKINPSINVMVYSGYSNDPVLADYKKYGFKSCLTKPFSVEELSEALQKTHSDRKYS